MAVMTVVVLGEERAKTVATVAMVLLFAVCVSGGGLHFPPSDFIAKFLPVVLGNAEGVFWRGEDDIEDGDIAEDRDEDDRQIDDCVSNIEPANAGSS